jgi:hypothetical protein
VTLDGYWPGSWPAEDGGPARRQVVPGALGLLDGGALQATSRFAPAATMVVTREPGELFLLRHTAGEGAVSFVERIDPSSLEPVARSVDLAGGPVWPGGLAAHADGALHVVFGNHAHRLDHDLTVVASRTLPRELPYNSFVVLPDGNLVTKDFAGSRPGVPIAPGDRRPSELVVLEPEHLDIVARLELPEPSIARLSADGDDIYVVGDTGLMRVRWDGTLQLDPGFTAPYRVLAGQSYGWDCVLAAGAAWFLDSGDGSERFAGTLRGVGSSPVPLHLVRVDLASGLVTMAEVCGLPDGLVANPPVVDEHRGIAVGYDSGNGVMTGFDIDDRGIAGQRWTRQQDHGGHLLLFAGSGELLTGDFDRAGGIDQAVVLDVTSGEELGRVDTGSPMQSVLFPAVDHDGALYTCSLSTVTRLVVV